MATYYVKHFPHDVPFQDIQREAELQEQAARLGFAPKVHEVTEHSIVMDNINEMTIADMYGTRIRDVPKSIRESILYIVYKLFLETGIEYLDVTPYNFIEKDGVVWIIDFGHARYASGRHLDPYLSNMFGKMKLSKWNPKFR